MSDDLEIEKEKLVYEHDLNEAFKIIKPGLIIGAAVGIAAGIGLAILTDKREKK